MSDEILNQDVEEKKERKKRVQPKRLNIDWNIVEKLFQIYCSREEVAYTIGVSEPLLKLRCKEELGITITELERKGRSAGNVSLRRTGYMMAQENDRIWTFFAKNFLGMSDKTEIDVNGINNTQIQGSVVLQMTDQQKANVLNHMKSIGLLDDNGNIIKKIDENVED